MDLEGFLKNTFEGGAFLEFIGSLDGVELSKWYNLEITFYKVSDGNIKINQMSLKEEGELED